MTKKDLSKWLILAIKKRDVMGVLEVVGAIIERDGAIAAIALIRALFFYPRIYLNKQDYDFFCLVFKTLANEL
jgi:hypothetical protein